MAKSQRVSVSKAKLTETGEELQIAGAMTEFSGAESMMEGVDDLKVARGGSSRRRGGSGIGSERPDQRRGRWRLWRGTVQELSEVVGAAGMLDVAEGIDMVMKGGDVRAMGGDRRPDERGRPGARVGDRAPRRRVVDGQRGACRRWACRLSPRCLPIVAHACGK